MKTFFTADPHFNHKNIVGPKVSEWKTGFRNFEDLEQMNKELIYTINNTVEEDDVLYILGDFAWVGAEKHFRHALRCRNIHLILGNHDKQIRKKVELQGMFASTQEVLYSTIEGQALFMSHYAHRVWPGSHKGVIHLYGHSHNKLMPKEWGRSMDVGLDTHPEFRPYSLEEIIRLLPKTPKIIDGQ